MEVFLYGDAEKLPPDARANFERWLEMGEVKPLLSSDAGSLSPFEILVDGLFGSGLKRPLSKELLARVQNLQCNRENGYRRFEHKTIAIDCPSCVEIDSGRALVPEKMWVGDLHFDFLADLTVTFHAFKTGHVLAGAEPFSSYSRKVVVKSIGLDKRAGLRALGQGREKREQKVAYRRQVARLLSREQYASEEYDWSPLSKDAGYKYSFGHALILSGGAGRTGAARLAARGALRIGAGLVTLGVPGSAQLEVAAQVTAIMLQRVGTGEELASALEDARITALCLGPGMGAARARALVPVALQSNRATVLDADALTAFENAPQTLFDLLHENCVLTPHGGEFRRLFPDIAEELNAPAPRGPAYSKVDATRAAAARAGCVVLFKGANTVIAHPNGRCSVNAAVYERAAPWLATAGSGDVLAGFIAGLLARGFSPLQAAQAAAWLHVECALSFGPGLIAEDLPEELPKVFRALEV